MREGPGSLPLRTFSVGAVNGANGLGTHHSSDVFMVIFVGEAHLQLDGGQSFQDRGTKVKQGGDTVVGCILQGEKRPLDRWGTQIWRCGAAVVPAGPVHPSDNGGPTPGPGPPSSSATPFDTPNPAPLLRDID